MGSTLDAEGFPWNALLYDGRLVLYAPDGRVDRIIDMPVKKITSMMLGGPKLDTLYVTSMAKTAAAALPRRWRSRRQPVRDNRPWHQRRRGTALRRMTAAAKEDRGERRNERLLDFYMLTQCVSAISSMGRWRPPRFIAVRFP
nr:MULTISPECIES: SMP-30/gluconolactonase/LRE family protein [Mesorhizobium]